MAWRACMDGCMLRASDGGASDGTDAPFSLGGPRHATPTRIPARTRLDSTTTLPRPPLAYRALGPAQRPIPAHDELLDSSSSSSSSIAITITTRPFSHAVRHRTNLYPSTYLAPQAPPLLPPPQLPPKRCTHPPPTHLAAHDAPRMRHVGDNTIQ